jgi:hypothetical protein
MGLWLLVWLVYCLSAPHVTGGPVLKGPTVYLACLLGMFLLASVFYL